MKRKRMIKLLMAAGIPRNEAVVYANACGPRMSHGFFALCIMLEPKIREVVRPRLHRILQGRLTFKVELENLKC